jgi:hypothetical protein
MSSKQRVAGLLATALLLGACGENSEGERRSIPQPTTGAYVSVAVDNHFHDIHPDEPPEIAADRPLVIKNQGRNLHNFTVVDTDIERDVRPGKELRFDPVGDFLEPGIYQVFCKYHADQGMVGEFAVVGTE